MAEKIKYPRVCVSARTHARVKRAAKKLDKDMKDIGNAIVIEGLKALGY